MKKLLLTALVAVYSVMLISAAKAEISLSGYQEFYMGSADQSKQTGVDTSTGVDISNSNFSGFSNGRFTRLIAVAKTTLDSGIEVTGTYTIAKDNDAGGDADTGQVAVDQNDIVFSGNFGNIAFGNNFSVGSMMHYRGTTLIPTAEPDNDQINRFVTNGNASYGRFDEAGYALDGMKIRYMSNVYDGFSFGISYEPCMLQHGNAASSTNCNSTTAPTGHGQYSDLTETVLKYNYDFGDGTIGFTYGYQTGNVHTPHGTVLEYNNLEGTTYSGQLTYAGLTAIVRRMELGDSGQDTSNTDDGDEVGDILALKYNMGNITVGYANVTSEIAISGDSSKSESVNRVFGIGYNLGGGVNLEAAYMNKEEKDNGTTDTDADIVITKISFGF